MPPEASALFESRLDRVDLEAGQMLHEAGSVLRHVYFPGTAVVSLVSSLLDGACTEVAVVGREGIVGVCAFMGGGMAQSGATVQRPGVAWRMSARDISDLARDHEAVMERLLRYTQVLFTHMAQGSACNRHHALEQQLCRWLLQHVDRQSGNDLRVTHERIAGMLGVRREGVTGAAQKLQRTGLIVCRRGHVQVIDRSGLEAHSCECYQVVQKAYARLGGDVPVWPRARMPAPAQAAREALSAHGA